MTPVENIIEMGLFLGLNENSKVIDLCCGYGTMLKILCQEYNINGKGIDLSEEFIDIGKKRIEKANISEKITLECNDIKNCKDNNFDVVICTETYIFGSVENAIHELKKFIKPTGKIIIGLLTSQEETIPQELIDFDGINLYREIDLYDMFLKNGYAITFIARSTHSQWDKYFTWDSQRTVTAIRQAKTTDEKEKSEVWLKKWYTMYAKYRIKYEQWCLYSIEKI
jgi:cyclopropane fatty-acyl-phospholipid synthase-like methyltransferase